MEIADDGSTPITVGTGTRTIPGVGRRFIMAAGSTIIVGDGAGRPALSGVLLGSVGATVALIVAGPHCRLAPVPDFTSASGSPGESPRGATPMYRRIMCAPIIRASAPSRMTRLDAFMVSHKRTIITP